MTSQPAPSVEIANFKHLASSDNALGFQDRYEVFLVGGRQIQAVIQTYPYATWIKIDDARVRLDDTPEGRAANRLADRDRIAYAIAQVTR